MTGVRELLNAAREAAKWREVQGGGARLLPWRFWKVIEAIEA
jgi:hypothetical protein